MGLNNGLMELTIALPSDRMVIEARSQLEQAHAFHVSTIDESMNAQLLLIGIKAKIRQLNEERLAITRPIQASIKRIIALYDGPIDCLGKAKELIDRQILEFNNLQEVQAQAQQARARALAEEERARLIAEGLHARADMVVAEIIEKPVITLPGVSVRQIWKFRVTDPSRINPDFTIANDTKIGATVRALGKAAEQLIGGIEVYQEQILASRAKDLL